MSNLDVVLKEALSLEGAKAVALFDHGSGMALATAGDAGLDLELAAAGNSDVIRAKLRTMDSLGIEEEIEDILITLGSQYHLIRLVKSVPGQLFLYYVLDKSRANLAMARHRLLSVEQNVVL